MSQTESIERHFCPEASNLYIFFGGIAAGIAMPPFEFYNAARILEENKIFVRDVTQCWYHNGLAGESRDILSTAEWLKNEIRKLNPERVFFVGNSMGGYAAILFATLVGQGEVIAFAPQTFISPSLRFKSGDRRWFRKIFRTYVRGFFKHKIWDLAALLLEKRQSQKISIYVSRTHRLDHVHASHLKGIPGVQIYEFDGGGHGLVKMLRDEGKLPAIMAGTYSGG